MVRLGNSETRVQVGRRGRRSRARHGKQFWATGSKRGAAWGNGGQLGRRDEREGQLEGTGDSLGAGRDGRDSLGMDGQGREGYLAEEGRLVRMLLANGVLDMHRHC